MPPPLPLFCILLYLFSLYYHPPLFVQSVLSSSSIYSICTIILLYLFSLHYHPPLFVRSALSSVGIITLIFLFRVHYHPPLFVQSVLSSSFICLVCTMILLYFFSLFWRYNDGLIKWKISIQIPVWAV